MCLLFKLICYWQDHLICLFIETLLIDGAGNLEVRWFILMHMYVSGYWR